MRPEEACGAKAWYSSRREAKRAASAIHAQGRGRYPRMRAYRCPAGCGGWHLTSQDAEGIAKMRTWFGKTGRRE